jgi:hypothetical protein
LASPAEGHVGDAIWLSGSGLQPNAQYTLLMSCPNWYDPSVWADQNFQYISPGPTTDKNGRFVRFFLSAIQLHNKSGSLCHIYAQPPPPQPGQNLSPQLPFGPSLPAIYTIVPRSERLPLCDVQICGTVSTSPHPARAGLFATFLIKSGGWGGAWASVTIAFDVSGAKPIRWSGSLHWDGTYPLSVRIPPQATHVTTASVSATFRLGRATGKARPITFTVVK